MPMALVAVEQYFPKPQRVIDDGLAARLLPLGGMIFVRFLRPRWMRDWIIGLSEKSNPGIWGRLSCAGSAISTRRSLPPGTKLRRW